MYKRQVKAYCDTLGLEYTSVKDALKSISKVEKGLSLLSKYTTICETIKHAGNVNESAVQSLSLIHILSQHIKSIALMMKVIFRKLY